MKRKKIILEQDMSNIIFSDKRLKISKSNDGLFFEIGKELTTDIAEAVSIMMNSYDLKHSVWDLSIDMSSIEITPEKSLFWLTGGSSEWYNLEHYNTLWCDCYLTYQEEFGIIIANIVNGAKCLNDIRVGFLKYLNLPTLYEFAISNNLIK